MMYIPPLDKRALGGGGGGYMQAHRFRVAHLFRKRPPHRKKIGWGLVCGREYIDMVALFTIFYILLHENLQVPSSRSRRAELVGMP